MKTSFISVILLSGSLLCYCHNPSKHLAMNAQEKDRQPVVAGQFYPADSAELTKMLSEFFKGAPKPTKNKHIRALVAPHAGYVFSGAVAAASYNQLNPEVEYQRIFILASSHRISFGKASIYNQGDYFTPIGRVQVDRNLATQLIEQHDIFVYNPDAHNMEHSIEVQLPFLQYHLKKPFKIVPIVLGTHLPATCEKIAEILAPYFNRDNLFILSSDFSHYPAYEDAVKADHRTADAFCSNRPDLYLQTLKQNEQMHIPGLVTSMCAWPSALTLLYMTQKSRSLEFHQVKYQNSGDIRLYGDHSSVVGYYAIEITEKDADKKQKPSCTLSEQEKKILLEISRETLESYLRSHTIPDIPDTRLTGHLKEQHGAFVTLRNGEQLRGCIGSFEPDKPLYQLIQSLSISSATHDTRFLPVQSRELNHIHIEISVLTPMQKIDDIQQIVLGKHGIYIKKGYRSGTFLPQVATETGWDLEEFLGHCARDKAGLGWTGWKNADIYVYEAIVFEEKQKD